LINIRALSQLDPVLLEALTDLLIAVVDDGASIGFLPPLARDEARAYWQHVLGPATVLLVADENGRIVGSAQLHLELRANGRHRAQVAKLMVHPGARRRGLARQLMGAVEAAACREQRSLLVLDTRDGDPSNALYRSLGYVEVGRVPRYARSANGALDASVFYYKELYTSLNARSTGGGAA
jgi:ribosomal protein S18 acetylase RimI-like enzyme